MATAHASLTDPNQEGNAVYMRIKNILQNIRSRGPDIRFIYTWRKNASGQMTFIVDAETDPNEISHLGEVYSTPNPLYCKNSLILIVDR